MDLHREPLQGTIGDACLGLRRERVLNSSAPRRFDAFTVERVGFAY
jgi:hypothetical protein